MSFSSGRLFNGHQFISSSKTTDTSQILSYLGLHGLRRKTPLKKRDSRGLSERSLFVDIREIAALAELSVPNEAPFSKSTDRNSRTCGVDVSNLSIFFVSQKSSHCFSGPEYCSRVDAAKDCVKNFSVSSGTSLSLNESRIISLQLTPGSSPTGDTLICKEIPVN